MPAPVARVIDEFVAACVQAFGDDLISVVLYGSAAEGRLRATSDVNVIVVLRRFTAEQADRLRRPLQVANAAVQLLPMLVLDSELPAAAEAFAVKFDDVLHRRRVLHGTDPFAGLTIPRAATIARLGQVLLNSTLRLREAYVLRGQREEQLALAVADAAGPLRTCAAALLELEGRAADSPRAALEAVAAGLPGAGWPDVLRRMSEARERRVLPPGVAGPTLLRLIDLAVAMRARTEALA